MDIRLGTSGWSYADWVGPFYPEATKQAQYLREYARRLITVEIDSTFYGIPRATTVERWARETPEHFEFSAKFPQSITHGDSLRDAAPEALAFIERMSALGEKLGPLLLQFPYGFKSDASDDLAAFLAKLPPDFKYALEVRHKSWLKEPFFDLLTAHGVALALIDHPWMPKLDRVTADFTYLRWLGDRKAIEKDFSAIRVDRTADLLRWKTIVESIAGDGRTVYGYFNNHYAGHSPASLSMFSEMLGPRKTAR
ncbi:MAG: DUF72 domain-containing protein [Ignavibacteria bacterium]|nr:DUF72 domain-containing protein [Ignavibacteria bacterium]